MEHPCAWDDIIAIMKDNIHILAEPAQAYYRVTSKRQIRDRLATKLRKVLMDDDDPDDDIK